MERLTDQVEAAMSAFDKAFEAKTANLAVERGERPISLESDAPWKQPPLPASVAATPPPSAPAATPSPASPPPSSPPPTQKDALDAALAEILGGGKEAETAAPSAEAANGLFALAEEMKLPAEVILEARGALASNAGRIDKTALALAREVAQMRRERDEALAKAEQTRATARELIEGKPSAPQTDAELLNQFRKDSIAQIEAELGDELSVNVISQMAEREAKVRLNEYKATLAQRSSQVDERFSEKVADLDKIVSERLERKVSQTLERLRPFQEKMQADPLLGLYAVAAFQRQDVENADPAAVFLAADKARGSDVAKYLSTGSAQADPEVMRAAARLVMGHDALRRAVVSEWQRASGAQLTSPAPSARQPGSDPWREAEQANARGWRNPNGVPETPQMASGAQWSARRMLDESVDRFIKSAGG